VRSVGACVYLFLGVSAWAQPIPTASPEVKPEVPTDILGRTSPRGTVLGFLRAARKGDNEAAAEFLATSQQGKAAADLAHKLFVVLDRRLPAKLNEISDRPEGSLAFLTRPDEDLVGVIQNADGIFNITVEKVVLKKSKQTVWLFSEKTLDFIPDLFEETEARAVEDLLPRFFVHTKIFQVAFYEWLAFLVGLPFLYLLTVLLNRWLGSLAGMVRRRIHRNPDLRTPVLLPLPVRLLIVAAVIRFILSRITLPLIARQFWSTTVAMMTICAGVWLGMLATGLVENIACDRLTRTNNSGATSVFRLGRRAVDLLMFFAGLLVGLHYLGIEITPALAGLGVGGIAVALAAQKTLENVVGGVSIIFDKALKVGDLLNVGNTRGFVEYIGLRSTRIRTFARTVVSVPNGQLATLQLENFAPRDNFFFNPTINLPYETTSSMMRAIVTGIHDFLSRQAVIDSTSLRVHLVKLAKSSFEVEVFAYVSAPDWVHFLEIQQGLLLRIMEIVEAAGSRIAIPAQILYLAADPVPDGAPPGPGFSSAPNPREFTQSQYSAAVRATPAVTGGMQWSVPGCQ
jgi:MscS family membrane protein